MHRGSILVVDDNPTNLKLASFVLTSRGFDVRTARNADEAMTAIRERKPRLVLMDIQLPDVDGLTLTRRIKADEETREVIVVALTAYAMRGDEERALAAGCSAYITKPIDRHALALRVAELMESGGG